MHTSQLTTAAALLALAAAQTYTSCNPLDKSCPSDPGLGAQPLSLTSFSKTPSMFTEQSSSIKYNDNQVDLVIGEEGNAPTLISDFYFFFGTLSVVMKASPGTGIISSIVAESDDLDEIDWEIIGGNTAQVETNYFGKGNTTTYNRATYVNVASPQTEFHNYTLNWSHESLQWIIDGNVVRTLEYADANGGQDYPQTPMRVRIGTWAGGDPKNAQGTITWAGGQTDYTKGPYSAYIKSIECTDASQGTAYSYGDKTGSWQSIKVSKDKAAGASASAALSAAMPTGTGSAAMVNGVANNGTNGTTNGAGGAGPTPTGSGSGSGSGSAPSGSASSGKATSGAASIFSRSGALGAAAAIVGLGFMTL